MSTEASSALTNGDLILEVARKMGVAYYGENGDEQAQIPQDDHDLSECQRHVNNGLRMFISDAPETGWRWTRPTASVDLWPTVSVTAGITVTAGNYDRTGDRTLLTSNTAVFYETMEEKSIVVTGQGTFIIKQYISSTQVYVYGSHYFAAASTFGVNADGNYTLPKTFAGTFTGQLTFAAATNRAVQIQWSDEATIRELRENVSIQTGIPRYVAISVFVPTSGRRRYQMMTYPTPYQLFTVQFPYDLHFDQMTDVGETPPTPISHDETIRAACLAVVERDVDDRPDGPNTDYYVGKCLPNSKKIDARSGPRKLGYFGNDRTVVTPRNFREFMKRPNVTYPTP